jgi:hypothetical protein
MALEPNDWRLTGQEKYLKGVVLFWRPYEPQEGNDHDHCEFCWDKFMKDGSDESLGFGYTTEDRYRWVCETCFKDFAEMFGWKIEPTA